MKVFSLDVGLRTGYALLDFNKDKVNRIITGTLDLSLDTMQELYDYVCNLIIENKPDTVILELPEELPSNPLFKMLQGINQLYLSSVLKAQTELNIEGVYAWTLKAREWKPTKSAQFNLDWWKTNKITKHEKDAVRIAHYWNYYGLKKANKRNVPILSQPIDK